jgi:tRNA(fMet)-specific endonuclease VapC
VRVLLDTSAYSGLMRGDSEILDLLSAATQVLVCTIVIGELQSGFRRGNRFEQNQRQLQSFLAKPSVKVVDVCAETAERYAEIDAFLWSKGRPIPRNDVWIAAAAMTHGCVLLTRDAHFRELPLLPIRP